MYRYEHLNSQVKSKYPLGYFLHSYTLLNLYLDGALYKLTVSLLLDAHIEAFKRTFRTWDGEKSGNRQKQNNGCVDVPVESLVDEDRSGVQIRLHKDQDNGLRSVVEWTLVYSSLLTPEAPTLKTYMYTVQTYMFRPICIDQYVITYKPTLYVYTHV